MKVGIDLGTTYCAVAAYDRKTSRAEIVPNGFGKELTPSVICFCDGEISVGEEAKDLQESGIGVTAAGFKRHMGDPRYCVEADGKRYSAEDLSGILLAHVIKDARDRCPEAIDGAVVTVPAYFNDLQRRATVRAAEGCGIGVMKIINEPTAAAVNYGYKFSGAKTVLVYDLGGGTFDATVVRVGDGSIDVLGTAGNHVLGGRDWDEAIVGEICDRYSDQYGEDPREDPADVRGLEVAAEDYKKLLSQLKEVTVRARIGGRDEEFKLGRDVFEADTRHLLDATWDVVDGLLEELRMDLSGIDEVLLCGGSTRMPQVKEMLESKGLRVVKHPDTDLAVAKGAAIVADFYCQQEGRPDELGLKDVTPHSLGALSVRSDGKRYVNEIVIPRNTRIPCAVRKRFTVPPGNMTESIEVYTLQGESEVPTDCVVLAKQTVRDFDNNGDGATVDVEYGYDEDGKVTVRAFQGERPLTVVREPAPADVSWMGGEPGNHTSEVTIVSNVVLCVDLSRSMGPHLQDVKDCIRGFVRDVSGRSTCIGLVGFGDRVRTFRDVTADGESVISALNDMRVNMLGRGTDRSPLFTAAGMLSDMRGAKTAVVLSDGIWGRRDDAVKESRFCRNKGISVVAVGFGRDADLSFLKQIATVRDGAMLTDLGDLRNAFNTIATAAESRASALREGRPER